MGINIFLKLSDPKSLEIGFLNNRTDQAVVSSLFLLNFLRLSPTQCSRMCPSAKAGLSPV